MLAILLGCSSPAGDSTNPADDSVATSLMPAGALPRGWPVGLPVLDGRILKTATGQQAGALRGKDTWSIQVEIDAPLEQCFESALNALKDRGLKEQQSFAQEAAPQAMLTWKRYTVIVTAMDTGNDQCTLWYGAGVDGLRLSG